MAINYCITTVQTKPCFTSCAAGNHKNTAGQNQPKKISWKHDAINNVRHLRQRPLAAPCWNFAHYWPIHSILMMKKRKTYILWHDGKKYHPHNWSLLFHQKIHHKNLKEKKKKIHHCTLITLVLRTFFLFKILANISIRRDLTNLWIYEFANFFQIWNSFGRFVTLLRTSFLIGIPGNISIGLKTLYLVFRWLLTEF